MGIKLAALAAAVCFWGVSSNAATVSFDEPSAVPSSQMEVVAEVREGASSQLPKFRIAPVGMANAQTLGDTPAGRTVTVSGPVLYLGTAFLLLGWFGWVRSRA